MRCNPTYVSNPWDPENYCCADFHPFQRRRNPVIPPWIRGMCKWDWPNPCEMIRCRWTDSAGEKSKCKSHYDKCQSCADYQLIASGNLCSEPSSIMLPRGIPRTQLTWSRDMPMYLGGEKADGSEKLDKTDG